MKSLKTNIYRELRGASTYNFVFFLPKGRINYAIVSRDRCESVLFLYSVGEEGSSLALFSCALLSLSFEM